MQTKVETVLKEIKNFTAEEEIELIEKLVHRLKEKQANRKDLSDLFGCAKGLWEGEDAQEYVNRQREERQ